MIFQNSMVVVAIAMIALPTTEARAEPALRAFNAEYRVRVSIVRGESKLTLRRVGDNEYTLETSARAKGLLGIFIRGGIEEYSRFALRDGRILPLAYKRSDTVSKDERDLELEFDWEAGTMLSRYGDVAKQSAIPANALDPSLLSIAVMVDRMHDRAPGPYTLIERGRTEILNVQSDGAETVKTRAGEFETARFSHRAEELARTTRLWIAPELGHLMVRMEQHDKGKRRGSLELTGVSFAVESPPPESR